ncbi:hypothetical protein [Pseudalkalibacillus sp. SCS-8]|uniref:hypothetical protein n=1 Tax=Pseudalkalibacillus nanhaiensis TaxID=3115291 RepID=UPI0032DA10C6
MKIKTLKLIGGTVVSVILGFVFNGGLDLEDLKFQRSIRKLRKESWFKELSDNGWYYERIYHNEAVREYLLQDNIVEKIKKDEQHQRYLKSLIMEGGQ